LSGTLFCSIAIAASLPDGGAYEYGAAIATGWPYGPCTPGTVGAPCAPQLVPLHALPMKVPLPYGPSPVVTQPPKAANSIIIPAVRFIASPYQQSAPSNQQRPIARG